MNQMFKAGDKVYCPHISNKIFTLEGNDFLHDIFTLKIESSSECCTFTSEGKLYSDSKISSIFRATKENQELLSKLYGIKFEEPKSFLDYHLSLGSKVLCLVSKEPKNLPTKIWELDRNNQVIDVIFSKKHNIYYVQHNTSLKWEYIYPISIDNEGNITYLD